MLWFDHALLPTGWARRVRVTVAAGLIESVTADEVNVERGTAMVWTRCNVRLYGTNQESLTCLYWERVKGKWRTFMQYRIRGIKAGGVGTPVLL